MYRGCHIVSLTHVFTKATSFKCPTCQAAEPNQLLQSWQQRIPAGRGTDFASAATLPRCYQVKLNDVPPSALVIYVYCIVARSRLTDVATMAVTEWETLNSGETQIAYCTEAVYMVTEWETLNVGETQIAYCTEAVFMVTNTGTE